MPKERTLKILVKKNTIVILHTLKNNIKEMKIEIINFRNMNAIKLQIDKETASILIPNIKEKSPALIY